jgi:hypothetical protein
LGDADILGTLKKSRHELARSPKQVEAAQNAADNQTRITPSARCRRSGGAATEAGAMNQENSAARSENGSAGKLAIGVSGIHESIDVELAATSPVIQWQAA